VTDCLLSELANGGSAKYNVRPLDYFVKLRRRILISAVAVVALLAFAYAVLCFVSQRRAESRQCQSAMSSICLAIRLWAEDHDGIMATNFICMSNEISAPKILSCLPARRTHTESWAEFTPQNCTYELLAPGMRIGDTNAPILRCTVHGYLGYSDCTVYDGVRRHGKFD
jgi:hypothetical protein